MNGYVVFNVLSESADMGIMLFPTDKLASVEIPLLVKNRGIPIDECRLYKVCEYDTNTMAITNCTPQLIEWDCRRIAEKTMNKVSPDLVAQHIADKA